MSNDLETLIEESLNKKKQNDVSYQEIKSLISETMLESLSLLEQETTRGQRFILNLPKFSPSEAWGKPDSMERKQIDSIFKVVRGGKDIGLRIKYINKFLDPKSAKRKTSAHVIINTMIIVESLKAAINHFSESAAGFVFEAFMAALTGGHQQSDPVGGTLPIEDLVAFSTFGKETVPVSLKLLSPKTYIKGSFTNLADFLFVRGAPKIKYLVAYKTKEGDGGAVGQLGVYAFDVTRENFLKFISGGNRDSKKLIEGVPIDVLNDAISKGDIATIAQILTKAPGYTAKGLLHTKLPKEEPLPTPEGEPQLTDREDGSGLMENLSFHEQEKAFMKLLNEGADGGSQWAHSFGMITKMKADLNFEDYGTLDFGEERFNAIAEIYAKALEDRVLNLLEGVKNLTDNIGDYFSERIRKNAIPKGMDAIEDTKAIKTALEADVGGDKGAE